MSFVDKIGRKARSVFYIVFISGLLSLTSFVLELIWDNTISRRFHLEEISFLESVGLVSFVYIIYFGIKFGEASWQNDVKNDHLADRKSRPDKMAATKNIKSSDNLTLNPEILKKLPDEEKEELKNFVSRCCGIPVTGGEAQSSFHRKIEHIDG